MSAEEREIEAYRSTRPRLGVEDLSTDLEALGGELADIAGNILHNYCLDQWPVEVYICGSFAEGTATELISDLDVRIVTNEGVNPMDAEEIGANIRESVEIKNQPEECGFVDTVLLGKPPKEDEPHVKIWESDMQKNTES